MAGSVRCDKVDSQLQASSEGGKIETSCPKFPALVTKATLSQISYTHVDQSFW